MASKKQASTDSEKAGHAYDSNLQSQHGPWANPQKRAGPYGGTGEPSSSLPVSNNHHQKS